MEYTCGLCATSLRPCIWKGFKRQKTWRSPTSGWNERVSLQPAWGDLGPLASSAFTFFDPNDPACQEILFDPQTTVPELFAIVRQWVPQVQHKIDVIGNEVKNTGKPGRERMGVPRMFG